MREENFSPRKFIEKEYREPEESKRTTAAESTSDLLPRRRVPNRNKIVVKNIYLRMPAKECEVRFPLYEDKDIGLGIPLTQKNIVKALQDDD